MSAQRASLSALILSLVMMALAPLTPAFAGDGVRLALVVGNSSYAGAPHLKNASGDAELVATTLSDLGFQVTLLTDASQSQMRAAVTEIKQRGKTADAVLFYYAGHGFQMGGNNFLVPTDASLRNHETLADETVQLSQIIGELADPSHPTIFLIDACRDNPLPANVRGGDTANGLAQVTANIANTYVLFATGPGSVSHDGDDLNGPFATALGENLGLPDQDFVNVMRNVRRSVSDQTSGLQLPWEQSSMLVDFQFNVGAAPGVIVASTTEVPTLSIDVPHTIPVGTDVASLRDVTVPATTTTVTPSVTVTPTVAVTPTVDPDAAIKLAEVVQADLKRVGCLPGKVDGDWGSGSQKALRRYFDAKDMKPLGTEPSDEIKVLLAREDGRVCKAAVQPKPQVASAGKKKKKPHHQVDDDFDDEGDFYDDGDFDDGGFDHGHNVQVDFGHGGISFNVGGGSGLFP